MALDHAMTHHGGNFACPSGLSLRDWPSRLLRRRLLDAARGVGVSGSGSMSERGRVAMQLPGHARRRARQAEERKRRKMA